MRSMSMLLVLFTALPLAGCATVAAPTDRLASSEAAIRGAREVGGESVPSASLYLKLAEEEVAKAKSLMADSDNETASRLLARAQADAELSLSLVRESQAETRAAAVLDQVKNLREKN
jgi:hypothetical protein